MEVTDRNKHACKAYAIKSLRKETEWEIVQQSAHQVYADPSQRVAIEKEFVLGFLELWPFKKIRFVINSPYKIDKRYESVINQYIRVRGV